MKATKFVPVLLSAAIALSVMSVATAGEMITNGNFDQGTYGQIGYKGSLTGWNSTGYNFLFNASNAATGVTAAYGNQVALWGPSNGSNNGFGASPVGGNFVGADGDYWTGPISQTVGNLVVGQKYNLTFYWAGAQQSGFHGPTTENWTVKFGNDSYSTKYAQIPDQGFSGWQKEVVTFTATNTSQVLSFLANGTPTGEPPFSLLDGVSMTQNVPEPASLATMGLGLGLLAFLKRGSKKQK